MEYFEIQNYDLFRQKIRELGEPTEIAKRLKVHPSTVSKWTIDGVPNQNNIRKILTEYNLTCEQLGIKRIKQKDSFSTRLKYLINEANLKQSEFAKDININPGTLSNLINDTYEPSFQLIEKIADYFDVNVLYLMGKTNVRNPNNVELTQILNVGEELIDTLKSENPNATRSFLNMSLSAEELGEDYYDLKDFLINKELLAVLKEEVDRIISYSSNDNYYANFEDVINERDVYSQATSYSEIISIKDIAHFNICKRFCKVFDKYVDKLLVDRDLKYIDNLKRKKNGNNSKGK